MYDGSCDILVINGCMDSIACNYNSDANKMIWLVNMQKEIMTVMEIV